MTSTTYVYTYIAFAVVYLGAALTLVVDALRMTTGLATAGRTTPTDNRPAFELARECVKHGQHMVDYTQLATLLPLAYIVGSIFLGSAVLRNQDWAAIANALWVTITTVAIGASIILAVRGAKETRALSRIDVGEAMVGERTSQASHKLASRLRTSTVLLVLVVAFTTLNLWSVVSGLNTLLGLNYVL
ncbi:MAG: hypothetical protein Q7J82_07440 [Coriobacteriia bacterium]|nr:hypothetical protein [Coriobacteriia bacterium]